MSTLNIGGANVQEDPAYRYKMPPIVGKQEGRGNGKKTVLVNASDLGKSLKRPGEYITKYCSVELGVISTYDAEQGSGCINGHHETADLQKNVFKFIEQWVLCPKCKLPETSMEVTKKKEIMFDCKACGHHCSADQMHKLATYIVNNPPDAKGTGVVQSTAGGKKTKADRQAEKAAKQKEKEDAEKAKADKKAAKAAKAEGGAAGGGGADDDDDDDNEAAGGGDDDDDDDDGDWGVDTSAEAVAARQKSAESTFERVEKTTKALDDTSIDDEKDAIQKEVVDAVNSGEAVAEVTKKLMGVVKTHGLSCDDVFGFIFAGVLDENAVKQIDDLKKLFAKLLAASPDGAKTQKHVLGFFETLVGEPPHTGALLKKAPKVLQKLYDVDLLEEEAILKWHQKGSKRKVGRAVREAVQPFITWLEEADEDSDDDDE